MPSPHQSDILSVLLALLALANTSHPLEASRNDIQGFGMIREERFEDAITSLELHLEQYPQDYRAWFNLGVAYFHTSRFASATDSFERSLIPGMEDTPFQAIAHYNAGNSLFEAGKAVLTLNPQDTLGIWQQARTHFQNALDLNPDLTEARTNLDRVSTALEQLNITLQQNQGEQRQENEPGTDPRQAPEDPASGSKPTGNTPERPPGTSEKDAKPGEDALPTTPGTQGSPSQGSSASAHPNYPEMSIEEAQLFLRELEKQENRLNLSSLHGSDSVDDGDEHPDEPEW